MRTPVQHSRSNHIFNGIEEGMDVYDRDGDHIGSVEDLYYGDEADALEGTEPATVSDPQVARDRNIVDIIAEVFDPGELPDEVARRLLHSGFIRIDSDGLFAADRYILPEQIASVDNEGVHLKATRKELVKEA